MAPEKAGGIRRRGGTRRGKSEPAEHAAGKDAAPSTLVDIDPWGALEKLWEQPEKGAHADEERRDERKAGTRRPVTEPRPRRPARSS